MSQKYFDMIKRQTELTPSPNLQEVPATAAPYHPSLPLTASNMSNPNASFMPIPNTVSASSSAGQMHAPQAVLPSMTTAHAVLNHVTQPPSTSSSSSSSSTGHVPHLDVSRGSTNSLYVSPPSSMPSTTATAAGSSFSPPASTTHTATSATTANNYHPHQPNIVEVDDLQRIQYLFKEIISSRSNYQIDDNVYEVLKNYTEALAQSLLEGAAAIARNRGDKTIDKADILLLLGKLKKLFILFFFFVWIKTDVVVFVE